MEKGTQRIVAVFRLTVKAQMAQKLVFGLAGPWRGMIYIHAAFSDAWIHVFLKMREIARIRNKFDLYQGG